MKTKTKKPEETAEVPAVVVKACELYSACDWTLRKLLCREILGAEIIAVFDSIIGDRRTRFISKSKNAGFQPRAANNNRPATEKQLNLLREKDIDFEEGISLGEASKLISEAMKSIGARGGASKGSRNGRY